VCEHANHGLNVFGHVHVCGLCMYVCGCMCMCVVVSVRKGSNCVDNKFVLCEYVYTRMCLC